jgi:uncharacterized protein YgiM (DUF1202 family)
MMKKLLIATIVIFTVMVVSPVNAGHCYRHHHHRHHSGHHYFWGAWAIGALTGALIASLFFIPKTEGVCIQPAPPPAAPPPPAFLPMSPGGLVSPENGFGRVSVEIYALNVRSGPGLQYAVTGYVCRDDILVVYNHVPGWLYVQLPSGRFGWVMPEYTTPVAVSANR